MEKNYAQNESGHQDKNYMDKEDDKKQPFLSDILNSNSNNLSRDSLNPLPKIKIGGFYIIDDICWLPYVKGNYRDNFGCEMANLETYKRLIEVYYKNTENFDLEFSFVGSGLAKIKKKTDNDLNVSVKVPSRHYSLKNLIKKIIK